ncbi:MAG: hypothetical protein HYZ58_18710, partial [Acidobacteria bacterium]|nr:hypothetical protein [Acidobacteriota bacterium]
GVVLGGQTNNIIQDVGGQSGQSHITLAIHGGRTRDQQILIDGLSAESSHREDSSGAVIPDGAIQEYVFDYSANSASSETGGVQVNHIPAEGGNTLRGGGFFNVSPPAWQTTNFDDRLRALGVNATNRVKENWYAEVKLGGPVVQNKLWFFMTHGRFRADEYVLGLYRSQDPRARFQVPDLSQQATSDQNGYTTVGRLTWQATPRNKFSGYVTNGSQFYPTWLVGQIGPLTITPEGSVNVQGAASDVYQANWASTVSSRLLVEAGMSVHPQYVHWPGQDYAANDVPGVLDAATLAVERNISAFPTWGATRRESPFRTDSYRGALSYVTGSHAFKFGGLYITAVQNDFRDFHRGDLEALSYITFGATALQAIYYDMPHSKRYAHHNLGLYAQDQWRRNKLTVTAGVRMDYLNDWNPALGGPPTKFAPVAKS